MKALLAGPQPYQPYEAGITNSNTDKVALTVKGKSVATTMSPVKMTF